MSRWTDEQQLAIDKENTNIIVSAGAGSGKTAVLTARVMRKIESGVNINQLLILTFTNKAAFEMKDRIRRSISKSTFTSQLDYIDSSYITTFDSFALSMVKKYSYLLNIGKNVSIADASIIYLEKKKIIESIFSELYEKKDKEFLKLIDDFCIKNDKEIEKYILDINDKLDLKYDKSKYLNNYIDFYYSSINSLISDYNNLIASKINEVNNLLTLLSNEVDSDYFSGLMESFYGLINSNNYSEFKSNIDIKMPGLPKNSSDESKKYKESIGKVIDEIKELLRFENEKELYDTLMSTKDYVSIIIKIIKSIDEKINDFKNKNNIYEFTDISKMAIRILKENENVRLELKNYFNEIMIDEYQDTSDLQEEFISMIENNNVYMVGDIKQSIYRFRNANPYLFKMKYDNYSNNIGGFKIDLTRNFRSRLEVVDNINLLFSLIMTDDMGGADYVKSHKMIFGNNSYIEEGNTGQDNNIEIYNYEYDKELGFSKDEIEIFFIANDIKNKVKNKYKIFDKDSKVVRDSNYGDFAILLDKSSNFDLYKKIFQYLNIPITKYNSTNITSEIEIVLIKNILKLLLNRKNNIYDVEFKYAFTSIARSYLFEYDDQTIFDMVSNNKFDCSLLGIIDDINSVVDSLSLKEIIYLIVDKFNFYEKFILVGDVKNRINRMTSIINIFDNISSIGYNLEQAYLYLNEIIDDEYKLDVKEIDVISDSVKIMTIHASKGLEFPVCYFAGLHSKFNIRDLNEKFLYNNKYGIITPYFKEGIGKTFVKDLVKSSYINEEISEKIRLLYVALTRAKEKMIMVTSFPEKNALSVDKCRSFLDMINYSKEILNPYIINFSIGSLNISKDYNLIKKTNYSNEINECNDKIEFNEINIEQELLHKEKISKSTNELIDKDTKEKMKFGTKIHEILELIDFKNPLYDELEISDFYKSRIKKIIDFVDISLVENIYKEYEFMYEADENVYHGIIDLMVEYDNAITIIDYKLKNIDDENYIKQLNCYKDYISSKTNKKIDMYLFSIIDGTFNKI